VQAVLDLLNNAKKGGSLADLDLDLQGKLDLLNGGKNSFEGCQEGQQEGRQRP
jgi:hypothetical protein